MAVKEDVNKMPEVTTETTKKKTAKKKKWLRNGIIIVLVIAILVGAFMIFRPKDEAVSAAVIRAEMVTRGAVVNYLSGSGMIEAMDSYDIVAKVQGDILSSPFEEGQIVQKDSVLYVFESEDAQRSLQSQQNSYDSQTISYQTEQKKWEKFTVKAPVSGYVQGISPNLRVGDAVTNGMKLAVINSASVRVSVPFAASAADQISTGMAAQLSSAKYMTSSLQGTVTAVDGAYGGSFQVMITFANPGQILEGDTFGAVINGIQSMGTGACTLEESVEAELKGELSAIRVKNGDYVEAGAILFEIEDEETKNSLRQSQINYTNSGINLQKAYDTLDNYTIKSPITGTVIQKNYKAGDTLGNSANSAVLATIADISKMKFTINVDELDIAGVQLGQTVEVTADAIEDKVFMGKITKIIQQGSGTSGVTTYPVEVTIDEPGELKIGMNVTGTVVMSSATNVVKVPIEAVTMRGGKSYVYVLREDVRQKLYGDKIVEEEVPTETEKPSGTMPQGERPSGTMPQGERPSGAMPQGERPSGAMPQDERPSGAMPQGERPSGEMPQGERPSGAMPQGERPSGTMPQGERPSGAMPQGERPSGTMPQGERPSGTMPQGERPSGAMPQGEKPTGEAPKSDATKTEAPSADAKGKDADAKPEAKKEEAYVFTDDDFELREVTTGVSSESEIEIVSGLSVGEYVKIVKTVNRSQGATGGMGGMPGMGGGMMPAGGMGGMSGMGGARPSGMSGMGGTRQMGTMGGNRSGASYGR